ncbi:hypothetical protein [Ornithinimicrobium kibberense]
MHAARHGPILIAYVTARSPGRRVPASWPSEVPRPGTTQFEGEP